MTLPVLDDRKKVQRIDDICFSNRMNFFNKCFFDEFECLLFQMKSRDS